MAAPLRSQLHVDQLLSNIAVKYQNLNYIHDRVFPMLPVQKQTNLYRTYNRNWVIPETNRAIGALARESVFDIGTSSYSLEKHALKSYIPDTSKENYDLTDLSADLTVDLTEKILMRKEVQCAALFTTTQWSNGSSLDADETWLTGTGQPIPQFDTATGYVLQQSGMKVNYGIIPIDSFNALKNHTTVVDRVKYTSRELNAAIIGALIGVDELLVPTMNYDSGLYGASVASSAIAQIWKSDFAFIGYKPPAAGFYALSSGYMFQRAKPLVRRWREEEREADAIEVDCEFQFKIIASLTGYYLNNTI
jgi:hypothetical protein